MSSGETVTGDPASGRDGIDERIERLRESGVRRALLQWADNNGIVRARLVGLDALAGVARRGVGGSLLLAVFDSHDGVASGAERVATASGDQRLLADLDALRPSGTDPSLVYTPVNQFDADGTPSAYDPRAALRRQIGRAAAVGLSVLVGYELEFTLFREVDGILVPAHDGPAYSPTALLSLGGLPAELLDAFERAGIGVGQVHAEYGAGQLEVSLAATDPLTAADDHLVARAIVREVAARRGLRVSFAPLTAASRPGNGAHVHLSVWRGGVNLLAPFGDGSDVHGLGETGAQALAGLLDGLGALVAVGASGAASLIRLRPGYFAGSYAFWGVENRDAPLRVAEGGGLLGDHYWNVEFRSSDASGNPYLVVASLIAAAVAGIESGLELPAPHADDPHQWTEEQRRDRGVVPLPSNAPDQEAAIDASEAISGVFTPEHRDAFRAVRRSDARWAAPRGDDEIIAWHLWLY